MELVVTLLGPLSDLTLHEGMIIVLTAIIAVSACS